MSGELVAEDKSLSAFPLVVGVHRTRMVKSYPSSFCFWQEVALPYETSEEARTFLQ
jgi:hypothetical protein